MAYIIPLLLMPLGADRQTDRHKHIPMCEQKRFQKTGRAQPSGLIKYYRLIYKRVF